jgi:hypothetical protein
MDKLINYLNTKIMVYETLRKSNSTKDEKALAFHFFHYLNFTMDYVEANKQSDISEELIKSLNREIKHYENAIENELESGSNAVELAKHFIVDLNGIKDILEKEILNDYSFAKHHEKHHEIEKHYEIEIAELKNTIVELTKVYLKDSRCKENSEDWVDKSFYKQNKTDKDYEIICENVLYYLYYYTSEDKLRATKIIYDYLPIIYGDINILLKRDSDEVRKLASRISSIINLTYFTIL